MADISEKEIHLRRFGKWFVMPALSIGSGIVSAVACYFIPGVAALSLPWLIIVLGGVFVADIIVHIYFFKDSVPNTLVDIFIKDLFKDLDQTKKILLGIGLFFALGGGLALAALNFNAAYFAFDKIALALLSFATTPLGFLIPIAGFFAIVAFFAYPCLLAKHINSAIKNDVHKKIIHFFKTLFTRNEEISLTQQIFEGTFEFLFTVSAFIIAIIGTIALMATMQKHLLKFFLFIPGANPNACKAASMAVIYGFTLPARTPFALESICTFFSSLGKTIGYTLYRTGLFLGEVADHCLSLTFENAWNAIKQDSTRYFEDMAKRLRLPNSLGDFFFKLGLAVIHALSFAVLTSRQGGAQAMEDVLAIPPEPATWVSGATTGIMAGGLAGHYYYQAENSDKEISAQKTIDNHTADETIPFVAKCS